MGLFNKKADPITHRAKALESEISALEAKMRKLSAKEEVPKKTGAKWRSTAVPQRSVQPAPATPAPVPENNSKVVFEDLGTTGLQEKNSETIQPHHFNDLGIRKYDLAAFLRRIYNHFRGKPVSNPKLVTFLAAGSIQGLRPLRYEKRVARNRFIFLSLVLLLVLWGLVSMFVTRR